MDDLAFLHERIESYADYTNAEASVLSDEQIRAYVGEALAGMFERLAPSGTGADALAGAVLRCQFADQTVIRALDVDALGPNEIAAIHTADRELVTLADGAGSVEGAALAGYIAQIDTAFDRRTAIITGAGAAAPKGG